MGSGRHWCLLFRVHCICICQILNIFVARNCTTLQFKWKCDGVNKRIIILIWWMVFWFAVKMIAISSNSGYVYRVCLFIHVFQIAGKHESCGLWRKHGRKAVDKNGFCIGNPSLIWRKSHIKDNGISIYVAKAGKVTKMGSIPTN